MSIISNFNFTNRQWLILCIIGFADFCNAICISLQAPFFPYEAEKKGSTATEYGLFFGIFEIIVFVTSPVYGKYVSSIGPDVLFNFGIFTTGLASIALGLLDKIQGHTLFISFAFLIRIVEALGDSAFLTASFAIIAREFPNHVGTTFASLESCVGFGLIVGPTVGGALYSLGGYYLPFVSLGCVLLHIGILTVCMLPTQSDDRLENNMSSSILTVLRIPGVLIPFITISASSMSIGFLAATLEPHVRHFNLSPVLLGVIFVVNGGVYALTAPLWGWKVDKFMDPKVSSLLGTLFIIIGVLTIGPAPFMPFETTLTSIIVGLVFHGIGIGAVLVSTFSDALRVSIQNGFPDDIETYSLISGLWNSAFSLGAFIGPTASGVLYDLSGFRNASLFIVGVHAVIGILLVIFIVVRPKLIERKELQALLRNNYNEFSELLKSSDGNEYDSIFHRNSTYTLEKDWRTTSENGPPISLGVRPHYGSVKCLRTS